MNFALNIIVFIVSLIDIFQLVHYKLKFSMHTINVSSTKLIFQNISLKSLKKIIRISFSKFSYIDKCFNNMGRVGYGLGWVGYGSKILYYA